MPVEMMRYALHILAGRTGGQHPQRVIDLHAVGIDHDAAMLLCQLHGKRGLAAGGRPGYQDRTRCAQKVFHMALVATLVANPSNPVLSPAIAERAADAVKSSGLYWLADRIACDIVLADGPPVQAADASLLAVIAVFVGTLEKPNHGLCFCA